MNVSVPSKPYHHGDLAHASLTAALELLREKGLEQFSLREVSRRLGVSLTALYHHFPDKEALLHTVARQGMDEFQNALRTSLAEPGSDPLVNMGMAYVQFFIERP